MEKTKPEFAHAQVTNPAMTKAEFQNQGPETHAMRMKRKRYEQRTRAVNSDWRDNKKPDPTPWPFAHLQAKRERLKSHRKRDRCIRGFHP